MKKIHVCLYFQLEEILNINDVEQIIFLSDCVCIHSHYNFFYYRYSQFDRIEVDYYD